MLKRISVIVLLFLSICLLCACRTEISKDNYEIETDYIKNYYSALLKKNLKVEFGVYKENYSRKIVLYGNSKGTLSAMTNAINDNGETSLQSAYLENGYYYLDDSKTKLIFSADAISSASWLTEVSIVTRNDIIDSVSPYNVFDLARTADIFPIVKLTQPNMTQYNTELLSAYMDNKNYMANSFVPNGTLYSFDGDLVYTILKNQMSTIRMEINSVYRINYDELPYKVIIKIEVVDSVPRLTATQKNAYK